MHGNLSSSINTWYRNIQRWNWFRIGSCTLDLEAYMCRLNKNFHKNYDSVIPPPWTQHASFVILLNPETSSLILTLSQNSTPLILRLLKMITWKIELHEQARWQDFSRGWGQVIALSAEIFLAHPPVLKCCYSILSLIHVPYVAHCSLNSRPYVICITLYCSVLLFESWVLSWDYFPL